MNEILLRIFKDIDPDIGQFMMEDSGFFEDRDTDKRYKRWELVDDPANLVLRWQERRDRLHVLRQQEPMPQS